MNCAVLFDNFGPYHLARLGAAAEVVDLLAVETAGHSAEYAWTSAGKPNSFQSVTLVESGNSRQLPVAELRERLARELEEFRPQVVVLPGWASPIALSAVKWCSEQGVPTVVMSESTAWDETRSLWREAVKRQVVGLFSAGLVGGNPHADYLAQLGMPRDRIFLGYDAVDNAYFQEKAEKLKSEMLKTDRVATGPDVSAPSPDVSISACQRVSVSGGPDLPAPYFLASARFIEKKNLPRLLQAYAKYREKAEKLKSEILKAAGNAPASDVSVSAFQHVSGSGPDVSVSAFQRFSVSQSAAPWPLILLGDGPLRDVLRSLISDLRLEHSVLLPGFKQYPDLPGYYTGAGAFIHASTTEQWGLVVNEAMASGLPVLVSNRCGCARDLVQEGVNGFTFDPYKVEEIAELMVKVWSLEPGARSRMGQASQQRIAEWGPNRFAAGLKAAIEKAIQVGPVKPTWLQRGVVGGLLRKS